MSGIQTILPSSFYKTDTVPYATIGELAVDVNGNKYRYVFNGLAALTPAQVMQEPVEDTQFVSMAVPANVAAGAVAITVTNGTTTVAAGDFKNGSFIVSVTPGIGQKFNIVNHTTGVSGAAITYYLDRPLVTALTTSSKISVRKNPYNGVIQSPVTTQTGAPVGVSITTNAASTYGWIQSGGDAAVTFDAGTNTASDQLGIAPSVSVAGAVRVAPSAVGSELIGYSHMVVSVDSTSSLAHIIID